MGLMNSVSYAKRIMGLALEECLELILINQSDIVLSAISRQYLVSCCSNETVVRREAFQATPLRQRPVRVSEAK